MLASSDKLVLQELHVVQSGTEWVISEERRAQMVGNAEGAIAREHATWIAPTSAFDLVAR